MFSSFVRQTHMYLALFLTPWIIMYALSTVAMNHRSSFRQHFGGDVPWEKQSEQILPVEFSGDATPQFMAAQILQVLHMDGDFRAQFNKDMKVLTIVRNEALAPRRISYSIQDSRLLVERQQFATQPFLERMHRRRGYGASFAADNGWAASVDAVIAAMIFWVLSGLWMWWELKITRRAGAVFALSGLALFTLFLFTI
jgi:hypothetical protein